MAERSGSFGFLVLVLSSALLTVSVSGQQGPTIRSNSESAIVWGEDREWAHSSTVIDPLTGNSLHKITTANEEVSASLSVSGTEAAWQAYSIFAVATIIVTNLGDSPLEVSGTTQTLEVPPKKYFDKRQIGCPYLAYPNPDQKKQTAPLPAEVKASIAPHASQQFSVLMHVHMQGDGTPDNVPDATNVIGAPVHARYSIRVNGVNFVFPAQIPTEYKGDFVCRPVKN
jgi:hypothetical protein